MPAAKAYFEYDMAIVILKSDLLYYWLLFNTHYENF